MLNLETVQIAPNQFTISGTVSDENPGQDTVSLTGVFASTIQPDSNGQFSVTFTANVLGAMHVATTDSLGAQSNPIESFLQNRAPIINNFCASQAGNAWILHGNVEDESPAGLVVTFRSGLEEVDHHTAIVMSDGSFSAVFYLKIGESGNVTARTQDWYGSVSNEPQTFIG